MASSASSRTSSGTSSAIAATRPLSPIKNTVGQTAVHAPQQTQESSTLYFIIIPHDDGDGRNVRLHDGVHSARPHGGGDVHDLPHDVRSDVPRRDDGHRLPHQSVQVFLQSVPLPPRQLHRCSPRKE